MQISRITQIPLPIDDRAREALYQIVGEIYCTRGAIETADRDGGKVIISIEPGPGGKNPEFEARSGSIWYAVEVKTPSLIAYRRERTQKDLGEQPRNGAHKCCDGFMRVIVPNDAEDSKRLLGKSDTR